MQTKVLLVSLFHPELVRGGAQQVCYELFQALRERPDTRCFLLASADATQPGLYKPGARITGFDGREDEYVFLSRDYDHWWHKVGEPLLVETFIEFLQTIQPDVVHFHHFLTFGVDLVSVTRRVLPDCRIVFTFHEFLAICHADGHMVRRTDRSLCDHASQVRCHQCFPERGPEEFLVRKMWFMRHLAHVDCLHLPDPLHDRALRQVGTAARQAVPRFQRTAPLRHPAGGTRRQARPQPVRLLRPDPR